MLRSCVKTKSMEIKNTLCFYSRRSWWFYRFLRTQYAVCFLQYAVCFLWGVIEWLGFWVLRFTCSHVHMFTSSRVHKISLADLTDFANLFTLYIVLFTSYNSINTQLLTSTKLTWFSPSFRRNDMGVERRVIMRQCVPEERYLYLLGVQ